MGGLGQSQLLQNGTSLLSATGGLQSNFQQTGRSIQQLFDALKNDRAAASDRAPQTTSQENAQAKQWMMDKGFSIPDYERDMKNLRACQKLISDDRQAQMAPGAKFGRLGGNRALNNQNFID